MLRHWNQRTDRRTRALLRLEEVEARRVLAPVISEFLAKNDDVINDVDGDTSDFIELFNPTDQSVDLDGWHLSDDGTNLTKWEFPAVALGAGEYLVVYASSKERDDPNEQLHTNFNLAGDGESLFLVEPNGQTISQQFDPNPQQFDDVSYGVSQTVTTLIDSATPVNYRVPVSSDSGLGNSWTTAGFNDTAWATGDPGIGFGLLEPGFSVRHIDVSGGTDGDLNNTNEVIDLFEGNFAPGQYNITADLTGSIDVVDFAGGGGTFGLNRGYIGPAGEHFAIKVNATVQIPAGTWTIGLGSDDGGFVELDGVNFFNKQGTNGDVTGGDRIFFNNPRAHNWTTGQFTVPAGGLTTSLESLMFERTGGDSYEIAIRSGGWGNSVDSTNWTLLSDGALGWRVLRDAGVTIQTDVAGSMLGTNGSLWTRSEFNLASVEDYDSLTLRLIYNDGFVAYLNGQEVLRRNAPTTTNWNSSATTARGVSESSQFESFNLTEHVDLLQAGNNVLAFHGLNVDANDDSFVLFPELLGATTDSQLRYFTDPTPNAPNSSGVVDFLTEPTFSVDRGFYDAGFQLALLSDSMGANIRYTTDGTDPTETNGTLYTGTITVNSTTMVRAVAYKDGFESSPIGTHTYVFLDDVVTQSTATAAAAGFPTSTVNSQVVDYGMDPDIVNDPEWGPQLEAALTAIPSISLVTDLDNLYDPSTGIYVNAEVEADLGSVLCRSSY